jgi:protease-4
MSTTRKTILIISGTLVGLVLIFVVGMAILVSAFRGDRPSIRDNSVLALRVSGPLPDYVPENAFNRLFGNPPQSLGSLMAQFRKAKVDKRISGMVLDIDASDTGWAKAEEIRSAIEDFRSSGKPVYAFIETGFNRTITSRVPATRFTCRPGELFVTGLAADVMFFAVR